MQPSTFAKVNSAFVYGSSCLSFLSCNNQLLLTYRLLQINVPKGQAIGPVILMIIPELSMAMICLKNYVRSRSQVVHRFSHRMWDPQNFVLKLHVVQTKLRRVQPKLRAIENGQN
mgnify:CR=1 FL=1